MFVDTINFPVSTPSEATERRASFARSKSESWAARALFKLSAYPSAYSTSLATSWSLADMQLPKKAATIMPTVTNPAANST